MNEAGLWAWFLFESGLGTQRAKELLSAWQSRSWSLAAALERAPMDAALLGLTPSEARQLSPPGLPPVVDALPWDDRLYPVGLSRLPIRLRPALLFYQGDPTLLMRAIVYLAPAPLELDDRERLREIINLLIGEDLLFAVYEGSPQSELLLEELAYGQGETVLFAEAGLEAREASRLELRLMEEDRLLVVSPLPPKTICRPALTVVLQQVAAAAADRMILSGAGARRPNNVVGLAGTPALAVSSTPPETPVPPNVHLVEAPAGALAWIGPGLSLGETADGADRPGSAVATADRSAGSYQESGTAAYGLPEEDLGPPPSLDEIIDTLSQGGKIPEALRKRLADHSD